MLSIDMLAIQTHLSNKYLNHKKYHAKWAQRENIKIECDNLTLIFVIYEFQIEKSFPYFLDEH